MGQHGQGDVPVPGAVLADLVVVQAGLVLRLGEAVLHSPPRARDRHQLGQRAGTRSGLAARCEVSPAQPEKAPKTPPPKPRKSNDVRTGINRLREVIHQGPGCGRLRADGPAHPEQDNLGELRTTHSVSQPAASVDQIPPSHEFRVLTTRPHIFLPPRSAIQPA